MPITATNAQRTASAKSPFPDRRGTDDPERAEDANSIVLTEEPGVARAQTFANTVTDPTTAAGALTAMFARPLFGCDVAFNDVIGAVRIQVEAIQGGNLEPAEALLMSQAVLLNAVSDEFARRAHAVLACGGSFEHLESYMRLFLRAQSQSRATVETLATLKQPTIFAKQANIANGPQQVNNTQQLGAGAVALPLRAREDRTDSPIELLKLEAHGERMDTGAARATGRGDTPLASVGTLDRPANRAGKGARGEKRVPRRRSPAAAGTSTGASAAVHVARA